MRREHPADVRPADVRPGVTVVMPCSRCAQFLDAAVRAVLDQDDVDPRVIIVDDASPDDSAAVARRLADTDPRVSLIVHAEHAGHIATCNDGLAAVTTEFVSVVSADDLVAPGALGRAAGLMLGEPRVGMVYGLPAEFDGEGEPPPARRSRRPSWTIWHGREWIGLLCRRGRSFIRSPEVVMRTEAMREVGPYNPAMPRSGDLEYLLRTAARWDVARVNGPVQAWHRAHAANASLTSLSTIELELLHRAQAFRTLNAPGTREALDEPDALVRLAEQAIAGEALLLAERELDRGGDPEAAAGLFRVAGQVHRRSLRGRRGRAVVRRLRRAEAGNEPALVQRGLEAGRRQLDRVRRTPWRYAGVS